MRDLPENVSLRKATSGKQVRAKGEVKKVDEVPRIEVDEAQRIRLVEGQGQ